MKTWHDIENKMSFAIIRRSSDGQKDNTSATTQRREMVEYANFHGLELEPENIFEIVETAYRSNKRSKYHEILESCLKRGLLHVLFFGSSRETRNLSDLELNEERVLKGKLVIHHVLEHRVLWQGSSDSDFYTREMFGVADKGSSRTNSYRMKASYRTKALSGHWPYRHTPLGYVHCKDKDERGNAIKGTARLVRDPDDKRVCLVRREFELRAQGLSYDAIREANLESGIVPTKMRKTYNR